MSSSDIAIPAEPVRKRGRPRKYTEEERITHRKEYHRKYYAEHRETMDASQKRYRESVKAKERGAVTA